jgi:hypothetical protein
MEFVEPDAETPLLVNVTSSQPSQAPNYHSILKSHPEADVHVGHGLGEVDGLGKG